MLTLIGRLLSLVLATAWISIPSFAKSPTVDKIVETLADRAKLRGDNTLDILILSGGGQNGAYGAGFLSGWLKRKTDPMPKFDMVTGISTGSLIAPYALAGTEEAMNAIVQLYRNALSEIGPGLDPFIIVRPTGGLLNRRKLEAAVARELNEPFVQKLKTAFDDKRQLIVGTTDLDQGIGAIWRISDEVKKPAGLQRFHSIVLASTAIPGAFAPVEIDSRLHTDGGVASNLLLGLDLDDFRDLAAKLKARGAPNAKVRIWVIVNLWIYQPVRDVRARLQSVTRRANLLMLALGQTQALTRLWELSSAVSTGIDGLKMEVRYTSIPSEYGNDPAAGKLFDDPFMRKLEREGFQRAQSANAWDKFPISPYERP